MFVWSFLVHYKTFTRYSIIKYLINVKPITSSHKIQACLHGLTCHFMLDRLHWCAKQRNRTSMLLGELAMSAMSYWYLCWAPLRFWPDIMLLEQDGTGTLIRQLLIFRFIFWLLFFLTTLKNISKYSLKTVGSKGIRTTDLLIISHAA